MKSLLFCFFLFISHQTALGKDRGVEALLLWKPHPQIPTLILPMRGGESKKKAIKRYLKAMTSHPDLESLFQRSQLRLKDLSIKNIQVLNHSEVVKDSRPYFLFMTNSYKQVSPNHWLPKALLKPIRLFGGESYTLPPAAEIGLSRKDAQKFRQMISETFDSLFALGGDDVHPKLYGEEVTYSHLHHLNWTRDITELRMIQTFNKKERGVFYGICRGSQLCAVSRGAKLVQDLEEEQRAEFKHWGGSYHPVEIRQGEDNLLAHFVKRKKMMTKSLHHQAIKPGTENSQIVVNAHYGQGKEFVVEAWQFPNKLGLAVQFHPELFTENKDNENLLRGMVQYAGHIKKLRSTQSDCSTLMSHLLLPKL